MRETREETGIDCEIVRLVGVYTNPRHVMLYTSDGEVRQECSLVFAARPRRRRADAELRVVARFAGWRPTRSSATRCTRRCGSGSSTSSRGARRRSSGRAGAAAWTSSPGQPPNRAVASRRSGLAGPTREAVARARGDDRRRRSVADDRALLVAAAYLHDIGYAPELEDTGFHPLDGARWLRAHGHERLAGLVAHHSGAVRGGARGLADALAEFPDEPQPWPTR